MLAFEQMNVKSFYQRHDLLQVYVKLRVQELVEDEALDKLLLGIKDTKVSSLSQGSETSRLEYDPSAMALYADRGDINVTTG